MNVGNVNSIILTEHAYAKKHIEKETRKLPECDGCVKTEIKIEEPDSYEGENEHLHSEPCIITEIDPASYDGEIIHIRYEPCDTTFERECTSRRFHRSQRTNQGSLENSTFTSKLIQENKKLKKTIKKLRTEKRKCLRNIKRKSKFYRDLNKMRITQSALQQELKSLKEENEMYKTRLLYYEILKKRRFNMEIQIREIQRQAHGSMKYEKTSLENIKALKTEIN